MSKYEITQKAIILTEEQFEDERYAKHKNNSGVWNSIFWKNLYELAQADGYDLEEVALWVD